MKAPIHLLIIDPQNDFCDIPAAELPADPLRAGEAIRPALPVPGAHADMLRLAAFMRRAGARMDHVHVTLDSHHPVHIANPSWWIDDAGGVPAPFTTITAADLHAGRWRARNPAWQARSVEYLAALERGGRYVLVVWPEHCLIGHWGHNVHAAVAEQLDTWARSKLAVVDYVFKGSNPFTEHYSGVRAEVPDPADPATRGNPRLVAALSDAQTIVVAGEALSHCVANTVRDLADALGPAHVEKLVLLDDCASSVSGFENFGTDFLREMRARGMRTASSTTYLA